MLLLKRGMSGELVMYMQERLRFHGFLDMRIDGIFGRGTEGCVEDFQHRSGLCGDGIVGDMTWLMLLQGRGLPSGKYRVRKEMGISVRDLLCERGSGGSGEEFARVCLLDLGKQEDPWGSNKGRPIAHLVQGTKVTRSRDLEFSLYKRHWGISRNRREFPPWCAIAISSWLAIYEDVKDWGKIPFGNWFGGVSQTIRWAEGEGIYREGGDIGECFSGELVTMGRLGSGSDGTKSLSAGHIGVILWDDGEYVQTIEGNTTNGVRLKLRKKENLRGVVGLYR